MKQVICYKSAQNEEFETKLSEILQLFEDNFGIATLKLQLHLLKGIMSNMAKNSNILIARQPSNLGPAIKLYGEIVDPLKLAIIVSDSSATTE